MKNLVLLSLFSLSTFASSFYTVCSNADGSFLYTTGHYKNSIELVEYNYEDGSYDRKSYPLGRTANIEIKLENVSEIRNEYYDQCEIDPSAMYGMVSSTTFYTQDMIVHIIDENIMKEEMVICRKNISNQRICN